MSNLPLSLLSLLSNTFVTFGSIFVTWSSAPGVSMPESVFRKTVHGAPGMVFRSRGRAPARRYREIARSLAGWAKPRSSQRPWIPSRKQRSAVWSVWQVPLLRWICEQLQTKMGSGKRKTFSTVERNLWICGHCAEGSIRPKLRHKMNQNDTNTVKYVPFLEVAPRGHRRHAGTVNPQAVSHKMQRWNETFRNDIDMS